MPLDLDLDSGTSTPVDGSAPAATGATPGDDFDFSDLKKKKKTSKKKAAFDLEAFEKELGDAQGEDADGAHLDNLDEGELGDDVFAAGGEERRVDNEEPWLGSDRDYIYPEVCNDDGDIIYTGRPMAKHVEFFFIGIALAPILQSLTCGASLPSVIYWETIHYCSPADSS